MASYLQGYLVEPLLWVVLMSCTQMSPYEIGRNRVQELLIQHTLLFREHGAYVVSFCPDNTCEEFRSSRDPTYVGQLIGFCHMYTLTVSDYWLFDEIPEDVRQQYAGRLADKFCDVCHTGSLGTRIRCCLRHLGDQMLLTSTFVRYDEDGEWRVLLDWHSALGGGPSGGVPPIDQGGSP